MHFRLLSKMPSAKRDPSFMPGPSTSAKHCSLSLATQYLRFDLTLVYRFAAHPCGLICKSRTIRDYSPSPSALHGSQRWCYTNCTTIVTIPFIWYYWFTITVRMCYFTIRHFLFWALISKDSKDVSKDPFLCISMK